MRSLSLVSQVDSLARAVAASQAVEIERKQVAAAVLEKRLVNRRNGIPCVSARILKAMEDGQRHRGIELLRVVGCGSKSFYGALGKLITAGRVERVGLPRKYFYRLA